MLQLFSFPFSAMASACAVHLYGNDQIRVEAVAEAAMTEVARIEQRYSRYVPIAYLPRLTMVHSARAVSPWTMKRRNCSTTPMPATNAATACLTLPRGSCAGFGIS